MSGDEVRRARRGPWLLWALGGAALVAAVTVIAATALTGPAAPSATRRGAALPPGMNPASVNLLQFDALPGTPTPAPGFRLTDQHGRATGPADFRGKAVVLTVNDDRCEDMCTLLAQDVVAADRDLGSAARDVVFLSVNANPYHPSTADVREWTDAHGLAHEKNWRYVTGDAAALKRVWHEYAIPVELDAADRTVEHGSQIYFLGPDGTERAMGAFGTSSANTATFGHVLAQAAEDTLPASRRHRVGGPEPRAPSSGGAAVGSTPAPVSLPRLEHSGRLSTRSGHGRYTVLSFWSSTCTACRTELPALEHSRRDTRGRAAFLGVDVADDPTAARRLAAKSGLGYPLVADAEGKAAGRYAISGLPFTVILDPHGRVLVRHPGALTTPQLDYLVDTFAENP